MPDRLRRGGAPSALRHFLNSEAAGGILLMAAAALAMVVANSGLYQPYHDLLHAETGPVLTPKLGPMTAHLWINDALMAVFFLLVGLEIKREFVDGRLVSWSQRRLPFIAAASTGLTSLSGAPSTVSDTSAWAACANNRPIGPPPSTPIVSLTTSTRLSNPWKDGPSTDRRVR